MTDAEKVAMVAELIQRTLASAWRHSAAAERRADVSAKKVLAALLGRAPTTDELREATLG